MQASDIEQLIQEAFSEAIVKVQSDDNTHFAALVVAPDFIGKSRIARHQAIYRSLGERVGNDIHALSIQALTPDEWAAQNA